jgi:uncharacterized Zn finger protein
MPWDYYEPSRPREAKGGIKLQSKRGTSGENWWAKRWMSILDSYGLGARLTRGRSYARSGQVLSIDIADGVVKARVQGSRPKPYDVTIKVKTLSKQEWQRVVEALSQQALFAAKLISGEMPNDIEEGFRKVNISLFPAKESDLETNCSCPDWSNPCKHTAAVYCLLGEEFDRDPFLLFTLRGITRDELMTALVGLRGSGETEETETPEFAEPLEASPAAFWQGALLSESLFGEIKPPPVSAALIKRLGNFPFWRSEIPVLEAVEPIYSHASSTGMSVYLGDAPALTPAIPDNKNRGRS